MTIAPIKRRIHTKAPPQKAFDLFTGQMGCWWPKGQTVAPRPHVEIVLEPRVDGRWFERDADGHETNWGKVLVWAPPKRLVLGWQLNSQHRYDPNLLTEVELTFVAAEGGGTEVTLEHRNLERFGADAPRRAEMLGDGWAHMLAEFAKCCDAQNGED